MLSCLKSSGIRKVPSSRRDFLSCYRSHRSSFSTLPSGLPRGRLLHGQRACLSRALYGILSYLYNALCEEGMQGVMCKDSFGSSLLHWNLPAHISFPQTRLICCYLPLSPFIENMHGIIPIFLLQTKVKIPVILEHFQRATRLKRDRIASVY